MKMRKIFIVIVLGFASLAALAAVQPAAAATVSSTINNCTKTCTQDFSRPKGLRCPPHEHCTPNYPWTCVTSCQAGPVTGGPGPVQNLQQQKTKYQR